MLGYVAIVTLALTFGTSFNALFNHDFFRKYLNNEWLNTPSARVLINLHILTMFHLRYNKVIGFFDWSELRCLCRALGFQPDLITMNLPKEVDQSEDGMTIKDLLRIINLKYLDLAVDKTFNAHTADWNLRVFKKAFFLLDHRVLTYQELHDIRVSFCAYEHQDLKGMEIDENTIIRSLKMCGRIIAPLKMHHRIKHMSQMFDEKGRIQLYEFLDLILWTELYDTHRPHEPVVTNAKKKNSDIYQVEDFHHIIQHYDERLAQYLNELYLEEEWSFGKEEFSKQKLPNELPVNRDFRLNNMRKSNKHYKYLKHHVSKSQDTVHLTSTGHIRPRPLTAPNLDKYDQSEKSSIYTAHSQHKMGVADVIRDYIQVPTSRFTRSAPLRTQSSAPQAAKAIQLDYKPVSPAVTVEEKNQREHDLQSLKFHISTLDNRYNQKLQQEMQEQLPKYVPRPKEPELPKVKEKKINPALLPDHINRLAYAPYRPTPKEIHAKNCDARFRGWHKLKTTKGSHYVLTTAAFSNSPAARQHARLNEDYCDIVKTVKGDCVVRKTTSQDVRPETTRPSQPAQPKVCNSPQDEEHVEEEVEPQQVETPRAQKSAGRPRLSGLEPIREGNESRKTSAGPSTATSTTKTYSFQDFKIYSEEYDKPEEKVELRAGNLTDTPKIVVQQSSTENWRESSHRRPVKDRRYSQITGDMIAREIVEDVDDAMDNRTKSKSYISMQVRKINKLADRRELSGYARKRLIDSAKSQGHAVSAC